MMMKRKLTMLKNDSKFLRFWNSVCDNEYICYQEKVRGFCVKKKLVNSILRLLDTTRSQWIFYDRVYLVEDVFGRKCRIMEIERGFVRSAFWYGCCFNQPTHYVQFVKTWWCTIPSHRNESFLFLLVLQFKSSVQLLTCAIRRLESAVLVGWYLVLCLWPPWGWECT